MRIWSLHPKYLDPKGIVALWREALLARKVLEGKTRGYNFDRTKVNLVFHPITLIVTDGQINYEIDHLLKKLRKRDPERFKNLKQESHIESNPLFKVRRGAIESWEIIQ